LQHFYKLIGLSRFLWYFYYIMPYQFNYSQVNANFKKIIIIFPVMFGMFYQILYNYEIIW